MPCVINKHGAGAIISPDQSGIRDYVMATSGEISIIRRRNSDARILSLRQRIAMAAQQALSLQAKASRNNAVQCRELQRPRQTQNGIACRGQWMLNVDAGMISLGQISWTLLLSATQRRCAVKHRIGPYSADALQHSWRRTISATVTQIFFTALVKGLNQRGHGVGE